MKLLINDKEIAYFLLSLVDHTESLKDIKMPENETALAINYVLELTHRPLKGKKFNLSKHKQKIKDRIKRAVYRDLKHYRDSIVEQLHRSRLEHFTKVHENIEYFIKKLGEDKVLRLYQKSKKQNFVKSTGFFLDQTAELIRRKRFNSYEEDCLIRNTVGNENLLITKIKKQYPFWFIDSGYTNFLEENKIWHRIIRSHLHHGNSFDAPVDRLGIFKSFPQQWRQGGEKIMVIEPGRFAAGIFGVDLKTWKYDIEKEIRQYSDRPIVFREKAPKKVRDPLYKHLCDEDYYCLININSNAATEAVWAGIPVITLDQHVTNPVTSNSISNINDLYRPNLAQWLCMLSYSQFTYEELIDGSFLKIVKRYHV